jgi:hypothetical protein
MSRHKLVKNLDLDNELDAFDGGEDYDDEEAEGSQPLCIYSLPKTNNLIIEFTEEDKGLSFSLQPVRMVD